MPLVRFDVVEGRSDNEIKRLLDAAHRAMLSTFHVPERDRYQICHEHPPSHLIAEDTGLGIRRTRNLVALQPPASCSRSSFSPCRPCRIRILRIRLPLSSNPE